LNNRTCFGRIHKKGCVCTVHKLAEYTSVFNIPDLSEVEFDDVSTRRTPGMQ
jgi:hypothetical protein